MAFWQIDYCEAQGYLKNEMYCFLICLLVIESYCACILFVMLLFYPGLEEAFSHFSSFSSRNTSLTSHCTIPSSIHMLRNYLKLVYLHSFSEETHKTMATPLHSVKYFLLLSLPSALFLPFRLAKERRSLYSPWDLVQDMYSILATPYSWVWCMRHMINHNPTL